MRKIEEANERRWSKLDSKRASNSTEFHSSVVKSLHVASSPRTGQMYFHGGVGSMSGHADAFSKPQSRGGLRKAVDSPAKPTVAGSMSGH